MNKRSLHALFSTLAAAGLAWVTAAEATNLSELPLKVSALAKPNIIFAMDDSGSMDWEVILDTASGPAYWNGTSAWDSGTNRPVRSSDYVPMSYLFPVGTNTGGAIYGYNNWWGQAAPPTAQFAWLRSSAFNPLYYNTQTTYSPWAPAYFGGALQPAYPAATTNSASAHPAVSGAQTLNLTTDWNSGNGNFTSNGFMFYMQDGMTLPAGARAYTTAADGSGTPCSGSTWRTLTAAQTVSGGRTCWAAIPYYPATFWHSEACSVDGSTCVNAPNGSGTLKRYEIRNGNTFPSGRTYADEMQNFANWFTYHRKRKLMLAAAMGKVLEPMTGVRMAVVPFNNRGTVTMLDADATASSANHYAAAGSFYLNSMSANGTPTHATMAHIANQFDSNTGVVQYACQRNSMFVVTDGFANASSTTAPAYNATTYGSGAPYTTTYANSLADLALAYYTNRLRAGGTSPLPAGLVPLGDPARVNPITNPNLHITTYAINIGARGTIFPSATSPFTSAPAWPAPVADDPTMVDDLWHATINGRGIMFQASDSATMGASIQAAFDDILNQAGAQASIGVSSVNLGRGDDNAYLGRYNTRGWAGDLTRNAVDNTTGAISTTFSWSASALLTARDWTTRLIFTSNNSNGLDFTAANVGATVNPAPATLTNTQVVEWMRGSRSGEGISVRQRSGLLGAVVNAEPVVSRADGVAYLASGEGMLHAFDSATGAELWAYHPSDTLASAGAAVQRGWVFRTQLDASPTLAQTDASSKLLVGGLGAAGRSYYALDVSNPRPADAAAAAAQFKWIFPTTTDTTNRNVMGYTVGRPVIAKTSADGNVVLLTSGYDNGVSIGDGKGRLWMVAASNGAVIKTFRTTQGAAGAEAGLAHVSAMKEADGSVRYAYGGDLLGNVWKFDLAKAGAGPHDADLVATLYDSAGNRQPVTAAPELVTLAGKRIILVGTGRILDLTDFGSTRTQSFYAIADGATLANARSGLTARTYNRAADDGTAGSTPLTGASFDWSSGRGWYFDLPAGEQANTLPVITYGSVAFVTNKNGSSDCSQSAWMYLVDIGTGKKVPGATFVGFLLSNNATASRLITLRTVGGRIFGSAHCSDGTVCGRELPVSTTIPPSKNAWRELRR
ncbi:MAG: pyrrolo-quinoline quinone [Rubrivivax sp.]|nr:pyrrolo-quinoline quinone [Rubrivivax sp.]